MAEGTSKRKSSTARGASTAGRARTARKVSAARDATKRTGSSAGAKGVQAVRGIVSRGVHAPASLVTLSRDLIQEVMDDAVRRGRMTRSDANDLVVRLCQLGGIKQAPDKPKAPAKRKS